ncbi:hypothetical protein B0T20DRAFT_67241 [Sordaria brevicollis]|uniref:Uncharacterized protein n=1 Tax=Sordaria brevicollis TaxID=83679 RepID=A0AAE0P1W6_SORBR|nr:hypothetical protein B0T20DRAFT_67241 [Sordaria brevicollis]
MGLSEQQKKKVRVFSCTRSLKKKKVESVTEPLTLTGHPCKTRRLDKGVGKLLDGEGQPGEQIRDVCLFLVVIIACSGPRSSLVRCRRFNLRAVFQVPSSSTSIHPGHCALTAGPGSFRQWSNSLTPTLETGAPTTPRATVQQWNIDKRQQHRFSPAIGSNWTIETHLLAPSSLFLYGNSKLGRPTGRRALPTVLLASLCRLPCSIPGCRPPLISRSGEQSVLDLESQRGICSLASPTPWFS